MIRTKRTPYVKMISDINITPFTDVCLVLLIIFMVTATSLVKESGLQVKLPKASANTPMPISITVTIDKNQQYYFNNKPTTSAALPGLIKASREKYGTHPLIVKADRSLPYQLVISTIDTARKLGVDDLRLGTLHEE